VEAHGWQFYQTEGINSATDKLGAAHWSSAMADKRDVSRRFLSAFNYYRLERLEFYRIYRTQNRGFISADYRSSFCERAYRTFGTVVLGGHDDDRMELLSLGQVRSLKHSAAFA